MMINQFDMNTIVYRFAIHIVTKCYFFSKCRVYRRQFCAECGGVGVLPRHAFFNKKVDHKFGWHKPGILHISTDGKPCYHHPM